MSLDTEFEKLLAPYDPEMQDLARNARALVASVSPTAHQEVETAWGGYLLFKLVEGAGNSVCWVTCHTKHVSIGFSQGSELPDPRGILQGSGKNQRHVKVRSLADLNSTALKQLLIEAWTRQPEPEVLESTLSKLREICLALPETSEKLSHGHPTFFAGKKSFATFGIYSPSIAFKTNPRAAIELASDSRFFPTPYLSNKGWFSIRIEDVEWEEVSDLLEQSYRLVATKKLLSALDNRSIPNRTG